MGFSDFWDGVISYASGIDFWEFSGLVFGLLAVLFLIRENIWTWPTGIAYVIVSFVVFWNARLYGDFLLHVFFLALNIYGWHYWLRGKTNAQQKEQVPVSTMPVQGLLLTIGASGLGIFLFAQFLMALPRWFEGVAPAALPYWDSTTSILSVAGMWLTARKKIENWYFWFAVDVLAAGIYFYKELYFFSLLYFIYIGMAVSGYLSWRRSMRLTVSGV